VEASTASFPSLSFPDQPTQAPTPSAELSKAPQPPSTQTTTLAIFDETLSTRTRALALLSSLAINLALPFVNGVMLGFGEIFAKNVVMDWLGWRQTTTVASNLGVGASSKRKSIFKS
jgi:Outer membrane protein TOM13